MKPHRIFLIFLIVLMVILASALGVMLFLSHSHVKALKKIDPNANIEYGYSVFSMSTSDRLYVLNRPKNCQGDCVRIPLERSKYQCSIHPLSPKGIKFKLLFYFEPFLFIGPGSQVDGGSEQDWNGAVATSDNVFAFGMAGGIEVNEKRYQTTDFLDNQIAILASGCQ